MWTGTGVFLDYIIGEFPDQVIAKNVFDIRINSFLFFLTSAFLCFSFNFKDIDFGVSFAPFRSLPHFL